MPKPNASPQVSVRLARETLAACAPLAAAAGLSIPAWIRSLVERETGVSGDFRPTYAKIPAVAKSSRGKQLRQSAENSQQSSG